MTYPWKELSPKDPLTIQQTRFITDIDKKVITFLYQPIIGSQAYSLYMTLLAEVKEGAYCSDQILHANLLGVLSMGIPEFYQARIRLEGIGLMTSYLKTTNKDEKEYVYEPSPPLSSEQFFNDDLLRLLLKERVGERKAADLQKRFSFTNIDKNNLEDITKSFLSVYDFSAANYRQQETANQQQDEPTETLVGKSDGQSPRLNEDQFDFKRLQALLQPDFFSPEALTKEVKHAILVLNNLYGIDEIEMHRYLLRAANLETGKVNTKELTDTVAETYGKTTKNRPEQLPDKVSVVQQKATNEATERQEQLKSAGYTTKEIALITLSEERSPFSFIANIKKQKNGHVTKNERVLLEHLLNEYDLTPAVLNILIYYVLVIQENSQMSKGFCETIADNWMQSNVKSPEQAIEKTKQFVGQIKSAQEKRNENRSNRYYGKNVVRKVEKLPEWAKENATPAIDEMMSEEKQKAFAERLKKFRNEGKAGDE